MSQRPSAKELLEAVREHLTDRVMPTVSDPQLRFQTLVAAHVLGVVERELEAREEQVLAQHTALLAVQGEPPAPWACTGTPNTTERLEAQRDALESSLCRAIREGHFDSPEASRRLRTVLVQRTTDALRVWNPFFLAKVQNE